MSISIDDLYFKCLQCGAQWTYKELRNYYNCNPRSNIDLNIVDLDKAVPTLCPHGMHVKPQEIKPVKIVHHITKTVPDESIQDIQKSMIQIWKAIGDVVKGNLEIVEQSKKTRKMVTSLVEKNETFIKHIEESISSDFNNMNEQINKQTEVIQDIFDFLLAKKDFDKLNK